MKRFFTHIAVWAACAAAFTACTDDELAGTQDGDGLFLNHYLLELNKGETYDLVGTVTPKNAPAARFSSADPSVAAIDEKGLVTAVGAGETVITAQSSTLTRECLVKVWSGVTAVSLDKTALDMDKGEEILLTATVSPDDINVPYTVAWSSSDPAVAVQADAENPAQATVKGVSGGSAIVTVKAGSVSATCKVDVSVRLLGITVSPSSARVQGGGTLQLTAARNPADATDEVTFVWTSSDENIATVDENGLVTGRKEGEVTITVTGGGFEATAAVSVIGNAATTVANIANNFLPVPWKSDVSNLEAVTVEWLMRADKWVTDQNNRVNTIFGIEGEWLLRIGDVGIDTNQLQLATNHGNNTPDVRFNANRWYHVAVVYDSGISGNVSYYVNGKLAATGSGFANRAVNLIGNCFIGKSYDNSRSFCGDIAEVRVWRSARSAGEIEASMYEFKGTDPSLVAYWKFNEGAGRVVKDSSGNGNDLTANADLVWKEVDGGISVE